MPVESPSLVLHNATTEQIEAIPTYGEHLRHSCRPNYVAAYRVYEALDSRPGLSRQERLKWCRSWAWFTRHVDTGEVRVASNACRLRWCPICGQSKINYITHEVSEWIGQQDHPKFITLTLKHSDAPLDHQVDCLYNFFKKLRRRSDFKKAVTGGIWFFQIKKSDNDGLWHPHLHCLVTGLYLPRRRLSRMWQECTYGSIVTDIRGIYDPQKASNDAARYASCPGTLVGLSLPEACELVEAMEGRRICGTWGTGRAVSLRPPLKCDRDKWELIGSWQDVVESKEFSPNARAIVQAWRDRTPLPESIHWYTESAESYTKKQLETLWDVNDEVQKPERSPP